jgi:hypothetical protein
MHNSSTPFSNALGLSGIAAQRLDIQNVSYSEIAVVEKTKNVQFKVTQNKSRAKSGNCFRVPL